MRSGGGTHGSLPLAFSAHNSVIWPTQMPGAAAMWSLSARDNATLWKGSVNHCGWTAHHLPQEAWCK